MNPRRPGLTLVDMLVALTILAVILGAVYAVFFSQENTRRAAGESRDAYAQGLVIMQRLGQDLRGAWLPEAATGPEGIVHRFEANGSGLNFTTSAAMSLSETRGPDLVEVGYRVEALEGDALALVRRQDDTVDDDPAEGGGEIVLTRDLESFELHYRTQDGLEETSVSAQRLDELPTAVRVVLTLKDQAGNAHAFRTMIQLPVRLPAARKIQTDRDLSELPE